MTANRLIMRKLISMTFIRVILNISKETNMGRLFGTDGVRGVANKELTPDCF
jgi:phosphomannomutase